MNRLVFALSLLVVGCNQDHGHGHGHGEQHDHGHGHAEAAAHAHGEAHDDGAGHDHAAEHAEAPPSEATAGTALAAFPIGAWTATLKPSGEALQLTIVDSHGAAVVPEGEAKVVLSGTGLEEQRLTLPAVDGGWAGPAKMTGAKGYTAVVSVTVGGVTESGKVSWAESSSAKPAPAKHDHSEGDHDHGAKDHAHRGGDGG